MKNSGSNDAIYWAGDDKKKEQILSQASVWYILISYHAKMSVSQPDVSSTVPGTGTTMV